MPEAMQLPQSTYDPTQGLGVLNMALGLQQKKIAIQQAAQTLQTGQYVQQQEQGGAQQQQEMMRERQLLQQAQSTGKDDHGNPLNSPDGQPDTVAFSKFVGRSLPLIGQPILQNLIKSQKDQIDLTDAARGLNDNVRNDLSGIVASGKGAQDLTPTINQLQNYGQQNNNNPLIMKAVNPIISQLTSLNHPGVADNHQDLGVQRLQLALQPASVSQTQTQPQYTWRQGPGKPGEMIQTQDNPLAGPAGQVEGSHYTAGLGLTQTPEYAGRVAAASTAASGSTGIDVDRQNQVSGSVQGASNTIALTQEADRLADVIQSGKAAQWVAEKKIALGSNSPESVARVELGKILGQIQNANAGSAGAKSVEALQQVAAANPQAPYPTDAIHNAMDLNRGVARQSIERNKNLTDYQKAHGNVGGFSTSDSTLTAAHDPLTVEYNSLPSGPQRQSFLKRQFTNADSAQAFVNKWKGAYHAVPGGQ